MRVILLMCLSLAILGHDSTVSAADDYGLEADTWNGLGYLSTTAKEAEVQLVPTTTLDLSKLDPDAVLFWLYPLESAPLEALTEFVLGGGQLIVADDFGGSESFLRRLGVSREPLMAATPAITPSNEHFLFFNVESVQLNHAVVLEGSGQAIGALEGGALIRELSLGTGRLLILGDPSVFINDMLINHHGNKQFAANVMRYFCRSDSCVVTLLGPWSNVTGSYLGNSVWMGSFPRRFDAAVGLLNRTLARLNRLLEGGGTLWLAALLSLACWLTWRTLAHRLSLPQGVGNAISRPALPPLQVSLKALAATEASADFSRRAKPVFNIPMRWPKACAELLSDPETSVDMRRDAREALVRIQAVQTRVREDDAWTLESSDFVHLVNDARLLVRYLEIQDGTKS